MSENGQQLTGKDLTISTISRLGISISRLPSKERGSFCIDYHLLLECLADAVQLLGEDKEYSQGESNVAAFSRILVCDQWDFENEKVPIKVLEQWLTNFLADAHIAGTLPDIAMRGSCVNSLRFVRERLPVHVREVQHSSRTECDGYMSIAMEYTIKARRCRTKDGRICQIPHAARIGDEIMFLAESEVPYVLRRFSDGAYSFIGECYVHGARCDELWDEDAAKEIRIV